MIALEFEGMKALAEQLTAQKKNPWNIVDTLHNTYPTAYSNNIAAVLHDPHGANLDIRSIALALDYLGAYPSTIASALYYGIETFSQIDVANALMDDLNMSPGAARLALSEGLDLTQATAHDLIRQAKPALTDQDLNRYYSLWEPFPYPKKNL